MAKKKKAKTVEEEIAEETPESEDLEPAEMLSREETARAVYAMLFASDRPLNIPRIAEALGDIEREIVQNILQELTEEIEKLNPPYRLREIAGGYQLATLPQYAPYIRRMLNIKNPPNSPGPFSKRSPSSHTDNPSPDPTSNPSVA